MAEVLDDLAGFFHAMTRFIAGAVSAQRRGGES